MNCLKISKDFKKGNVSDAIKELINIQYINIIESQHL